MTLCLLNDFGRRLILIFTFLIGLIECSTISAQALNFPLNRDYQTLVLGSSTDSTFNFHRAARPYLRNDIYDFNERIACLNVETNKKWIKLLMNQDTFELGEKKFDLAINPILESVYSVGTYNGQTDNAYSLSAGISLSGFYDKKLGFEINYQYYNVLFPDYVRQYVSDNDVVPGMGPVDYKASSIDFHFITGHLTYAPSNWLNLEIGRGKQFIGNGYRSLILSDNSNAHPYGKIDMNFWKVRYQVLYLAYKEMNGAAADRSQYLNKYSTSNYLSMNFGKHANVGLFQTVIWQAMDSNVNRGFDVNYLNPFIFMRPIEFSIGSPDNILLGLDFSYLLFKKYMLYGQVIIDEFLLNEVRSNSGWWANKYGIQLGFKLNDPLGLNGFTFLTEYNYVRPFTYSHGNVVQNYGSYNQPLAHTLGANFNEIVVRATYHKKRWLGVIHGSLARKGEDYPGTNYGGDIFLSNTTRVQDYDNRTGQGLSTNIYYGQAKLGYLINPGWKLMFETGFTYQYRESELSPSPKSAMFHIGLKTALYNQYLDY